MHSTPKPNIFYGAQTDMRARIACNLFLLCPNNSGSTFLSKAIGTSPSVWSLPREGQHALAFVGPVTDSENALTWASSQMSLDEITDPRVFDWPQNEKTWYFQAQSMGTHAEVFFTKAPPFLAYADMLQAHFHNPRFLIMVRNPYAMIEAIMRRNSQIVPDQELLLNMAVDHAVSCLQMQRCNRETYRENSVFFTYEEMCRAPKSIETKIKTLVPEIKTLQLNQRLLVKHDYYEPLRDMNDQQIARLSPHHVARISNRLEPNAALLASFGYSIFH